MIILFLYRYWKKSAWIVINQFSENQTMVNGFYMNLRQNDCGISKDLLIEKKREPFYTNLFKKEVSAMVAPVMVDIGANIGYYTLIASKYCKKIMAFEPDPITCDILSENIELNDIKNVETFQLLVGTNSHRRLYVSNQSNLASCKVKTKKSIMVKSVSLDDFIKEKVDILRMDVEGDEDVVIAGAKVMIKKYHPIIFIEIHPWITDPRETLELLLNLGYRKVVAIKSDSCLYSKIGLTTIERVSLSEFIAGKIIKKQAFELLIK